MISIYGIAAAMCAVLLPALVAAIRIDRVERQPFNQLAIDRWRAHQPAVDTQPQHAPRHASGVDWLRWARHDFPGRHETGWPASRARQLMTDTGELDLDELRQVLAQTEGATR